MKAPKNNCGSTPAPETERRRAHPLGNAPGQHLIERQNGRVPKLAPGGAYKMTLDFEMHVGRDSVRRVVEEIETLQRSQPMMIDEVPEKQ